MHYKRCRGVFEPYGVDEDWIAFFASALAAVDVIVERAELAGAEEAWPIPYPD